MNPKEGCESDCKMESGPLDLTTVIREKDDTELKMESQTHKLTVEANAKSSKATKRKPTQKELALGLFIRHLLQDQLDHSLPINQQPLLTLTHIENACLREFPQFDIKQIRLKIRAQLKLHRRNIKRAQFMAAKKQMKRDKLRPLLPLIPMERPSTASSNVYTEISAQTDTRTDSSVIQGEASSQPDKTWNEKNLIGAPCALPMTDTALWTNMASSMLIPQPLQEKSIPLQLTEVSHSCSDPPHSSTMVSRSRTDFVHASTPLVNENPQSATVPTSEGISLSLSKLLEMNTTNLENNVPMEPSLPPLTLPPTLLPPNLFGPAIDLARRQPHLLATSLRMSASFLMQSAQLFELAGRTAVGSGLLANCQNTACE